MKPSSPWFRHRYVGLVRSLESPLDGSRAWPTRQFTNGRSYKGRVVLRVSTFGLFVGRINAESPDERRRFASVENSQRRVTQEEPDLEFEVKRARLGLGWWGTYTDARGGIIGVGPSYEYWRPTKQGVVCVLRRVTSRVQSSQRAAITDSEAKSE